MKKMVSSSHVARQIISFLKKSKRQNQQKNNLSYNLSTLINCKTNYFFVFSYTLFFSSFIIFSACINFSARILI
ncbi:MAG: hypothetical protein A2908_02945 [Candidatus Staskawiczbacteria bacterium RIFCSPLOWO2_01_FULL_38_12b]|uniref:Uncharacterized protein n=1 Tax=Candidatus Staskawiczbacteria bacterium RIFCSPLOWO2_01_FULL_38_12b TaxID=1802214 RepID=A0A1G2IGM4_9BACT|nr:MAG: hypothetical protein A2908_02945 [Candidatus Staskawiczbacteria bacterium RIFCSPLOWO2_01_FULL_38_12b]